MAWVQERSTVNQKVQLGMESTSALGTSVAATKVLQCFDWTIGIEPNVATYRATGRKYDSVSIENSEEASGTITGPIDYNGVIYPLCSVFGSVTPVAHLASATAKDWIFTPPVTGSIVPQTYTIEQGDTTTRAHKVTYGLVTDFGYKGDRQKGIDVSCKFIAQAFTDGITMSGGTTLVALAPLAGKHVNFYMDTTAAGLGGTQLLKVLNIDVSITGMYSPFFPFNRTNLGWTAHVDMAPKTTVKLLVEADATGMSQLTNMQNSTSQFLRVQGQGLVIATDGPGNITNTFQHDMALKVVKSNPFSDSQGVFCEEWEFDVVEDATWGHAQLLTVTNLITAL